MVARRSLREPAGVTVHTIAPEQSVAAVLPLYDAFARRDTPAAIACMADDIEWQEAPGLPWGGYRVGPEAVVGGVFAPALERIPDLMITPEEVIASEDSVAVVQRYAGTVAATGASLNLVGVGVFDVRDGLIARYRQFVDTVCFRAVIAD